MLSVTRRTEPSNREPVFLGVAIVVGLSLLVPAALAWLPRELSGIDSLLRRIPCPKLVSVLGAILSVVLARRLAALPGLRVLSELVGPLISAPHITATFRGIVRAFLGCLARPASASPGALPAFRSEADQAGRNSALAGVAPRQTGEFQETSPYCEGGLGSEIGVLTVSAPRLLPVEGTVIGIEIRPRAKFAANRARLHHVCIITLSGPATWAAAT